jgi:hypothetical protein
MWRQCRFGNALRIIVESEEAGLKDLADELPRFVDWAREDLQRQRCTVRTK